MWYTRLAYRPALHRLIQQKQKAVPFADIDEENENTPDEPETPGDVATPTPQITELIPDLSSARYWENKAFMHRKFEEVGIPHHLMEKSFV